MQTFNDLPKHEHIITDPILTRVCIDSIIEHVLSFRALLVPAIMG